MQLQPLTLLRGAQCERTLLYEAGAIDPVSETGDSDFTAARFQLDREFGPAAARAPQHKDIRIFSDEVAIH
jgi:hypothetical protein